MCIKKQHRTQYRILWSSTGSNLIFKLVDTRGVETGFLRGLRYANVSVTHSKACVAGARKGKGEGKIGRARNTRSEGEGSACSQRMVYFVSPPH